MQTSILISLGFVLVLISALLHDFVPTPPLKAVGIDLGTSYSCVAIYHSENGSVSVLKDDKGNSVIASAVAFLKEGGKDVVLVGEIAKELSDSNPGKIVFDAKRLLGRKMDEVSKDTDIQLYPFEVVDHDNSPFFRIRSDENWKDYSPEEISSIVLMKLKSTVETNSGTALRKVVLAIPVEFNGSQRNATLKAAALAGLEVLRLIYEPTAAAMAYGLHSKPGISLILVFDFGGGTLDVSLLRVENKVFHVIATYGDKKLGGEDFNHNTMQHFLQLFRQKHTNMSKLKILLENQFIQRLRKEVERAKLELSINEETTLKISYKDLEINERLTRSEFNTINDHLFNRAMDVAKKVLDIGKVSHDHIDDIVLVGGSTRLLKMRELLSTYFNKTLNTDINPDEAVARGTAIQAAILMDAKNIAVAAVEV